MAALVVLFNLKDEAAKEAYENWAKTTDVPTVKGLKSVNDFKLYRCDTILGTEEKSPYQYCEVIDINDLDGLFDELASETMKRVAGEFQSFADGPLFLMSDQIA